MFYNHKTNYNVLTILLNLFFKERDYLGLSAQSNKSAVMRCWSLNDDIIILEKKQIQKILKAWNLNITANNIPSSL